MASLIKKCEICSESHNYTSGHFSRHLLGKHQMTLKNYVIKFEYSNVPPKCSCGYCNEEPPFVRGEFLTVIDKHKTYKWKNEQYAKKHGKPKCLGCGKEIGFIRDYPKKYCSKKCMPDRWNQEKCKQTLKENYGVDNPMDIPESKEIISRKNKASAKEAVKKRKKTVMDKYGVDSVMHLQSSKEKQKETMLSNHGVEHNSQLIKNRISARNRLLKKNPAFSGDNIRTKIFKNTNLNYQGSYELNFLELCEEIAILNKLNNGNIYKLDNKHRMITDFSINDYEIEIKSSWILKKQGGMKVLNEKRKAVENAGKKYIFILDKDYSEFLELFS